MPILGLLSKVWSARRLILWGGVAALIGLLWWRNGSLADQRAAAQKEAVQWRQAAEANALAVDQLKAAHAQALAAVEKIAADAAARATKTTIIRQEIARAPQTDSCGPAVDAAVDGLRQLFGPAP